MASNFPPKKKVTVKVGASESTPNALVALVSWLIPIFIASMTFLVFSPVLKNDFVNWDDPFNLLENYNYRGLHWSNLRWMFTTFHLTLYRPLTWIAWAIDFLVWGMDPWGYHLTSLLFHCGNAVLLYLITLRLLSLVFKTHESSEFPYRVGAGFAALTFSLHPLRVEAVAWASAFNDVLSGFFILLTLICYFKYADSTTGSASRLRWFVTAVGVFFLSLLAKGSGVTLPVVLIALDYYPLKRLGAGKTGWFDKSMQWVWLEKAPFFLLALFAGVLNFLAKYQTGAMELLVDYNLSARIAQSLYGLVFYLWKSLLPLNLSPLYERAINLSLLDGKIVGSAIIILFISVGLFVVRRRWPAGWVGWICYIALVAPVLGIFQSGPQMAADRYSYLSCLGWSVISGSAIYRIWQLSERELMGRIFPLVSACAGTAALIVLGTLAWRQTLVWHDSVALWRHALAVAPPGLAHNQMGHALESAGQWDEAVLHLKRALQIHPRYLNSHYALARLMVQGGNLDDALNHLRTAENLAPDRGDIQRDYALINVKQGKFEEALRRFRRALELSPTDEVTLNNLGLLLLRQGKVEEGMQLFLRVIEINPGNLEGHSNLANALLSRGDSDSALKYLYRALENSPTNVTLHKQIAMVLAGLGDFESAGKHLLQVVELDPNDAANHSNLAITLANQGELAKAEYHFEQALRIDPNLNQARIGLARLLSVQGKSNEATSIAKKR